MFFFLKNFVLFFLKEKRTPTFLVLTRKVTKEITSLQLDRHVPLQPCVRLNTVGQVCEKRDIDESISRAIALV